MKDNDKKNNGIIITSSYARWGSRNICHFPVVQKNKQKKQQHWVQLVSEGISEINFIETWFSNKQCYRSCRYVIYT